MSRSIHIAGQLEAERVRKGVYLVLLHADRVPPHIGMMFDEVYHSLSIKGQEINIKAEVILKNISVRKIPAVFIELKKHPVFSTDHLGECFVEQVKQFERVSTGGSTCLSPVRLFFEEFYGINKDRIELIFDLLGELSKNDFIEQSLGANLGELKENIFYLQPYNRHDLEQQIGTELSKLKK